MTAPKRPRDPNLLAKFIVDVATGEAVGPEKVESAVKGGYARSKSLRPKQRAKIAQHAAHVRRAQAIP